MNIVGRDGWQSWIGEHRCERRGRELASQSPWARSVIVLTLIVPHALRGNAAQDAPRPLSM